MFRNTTAFSSYSVDNLEKAKDFYAGVLGLEIFDNPMGIIELKFGDGMTTVIYPKPDHSPATFTVLNFRVNNIDEAVDNLLNKGVVFEHYVGAIETNEKGICRNENGPKIAWFKDPAGNILSVIEDAH